MFPDVRRPKPTQDAAGASRSEAVQAAKVAALLDIQQEIKASYTLLKPIFWLTGTSDTTQLKVFFGKEVLRSK
jgi:hypothetical protein